MKKKRKQKVKKKKIKNKTGENRFISSIVNWIKESFDSICYCDFKLVAFTLILIVFGVLMVFSSSYYWAMDQIGNPYHYLIRGSIWAVFGIGTMFAFAGIDYRKYKKYYGKILVLSLILLILLIATPLGKEVKGATRWLDLGIITVMPGELAKLGAIIFTAGFLSERKLDINSLKNCILPMGIVCAAYAGLIILQPNMSTAITVAAIMIAMLFVAGVDIKYFLSVAALGVVGATAFIIAGGGYRLKRVTSFLDPFADPLGDAFQVVQSLLAMGSGGLFGKGLGNSVQKTLYLPEPQNDFILAIIGEELGMIGVIGLIAVFVILIYTGIKVALKAPDKHSFLLVSGVMMMIGIQLIFNIAIVTSSMPPTGVALPFVSYGGNAMLLFCASMGIVLNVSKQSNKLEKEEELKKVKNDRIYFD